MYFYLWCQVNEQTLKYLQKATMNCSINNLIELSLYIGETIYTNCIYRDVNKIVSKMKIDETKVDLSKLHTLLSVWVNSGNVNNYYLTRMGDELRLMAEVRIIHKELFGKYIYKL